MGKMNLTVNQLLERKEIFADFINGTVFAGEQVLNSDHLELISSNSGLYYEENGKKKLIERRGDIRMKAEFGVYSLIVSNETQAGIDYAMPIRKMLYEALEYTKQVQDIEKRNLELGVKKKRGTFLSGLTKEDRVSPVMTIVFYCGDGEWDGSKSLHEMINVDERLKDTELVDKYLQNYKLNLIELNNINNPKFKEKCLQHIFTMVKLKHDKQALYDYIIEHKNELDQMDYVETLATFVLLGEQKRVENLLTVNTKQGKGDIKVCQAITDMIRDGEKKGVDRVNRLIQILLEKKKLEELAYAAQNEEYQNQLFIEYGIL